MLSRYTFRDLFPHSARDCAVLTAFLESNGLRYEEDIEGGIGAFIDSTIVACGCFSGNILKCFAIAESERGNNLLGSILSRLVSAQAQNGRFQLTVFTRPNNSSVFKSSGFYPLCSTEHVTQLENVPNGIESYSALVRRQEDTGKKASGIVMNCNPFTRGHRYLIEHAAQQSELLYVFVVEEDGAVFPFSTRLELVQKGVADLVNVRVIGSGPYIISATTFPTYFLKKDTDVAAIQAELDVRLFASRIAPAFGITRRYAGSEPLCPLTNRYNDVLREVLPDYGVSFEILPRIRNDAEVISASRVRELIRVGGVQATLIDLVPQTTLDYLQSHEASIVLSAIYGETV